MHIYKYICINKWKTAYSEDNIENDHAVSQARTTTSPAFHLIAHSANHGAKLDVRC